METDLRVACGRIASGRLRLLETRARRSEQVSRLRLYLQREFGEFVGAVDPVTGTRLVELVAEGNKAKGALVLTVALFEGSRLRIAVDAVGALECTAIPPELVADLGRAVEISVAEDLSRAELVFETGGSPSQRRALDVRELAGRVVERVANAVESDAGAAPAPA